MQYSVTLESDLNCGNVKMKTINNYKNPYKKESNLDNIVDQLCTRLQDIKDQEGASGIGMPTCSLEETEAVRRYYAAFPALKRGRESPLPYYLPPPAWCRKSATDTKIKMQSELSVSKDWNSKNKKYSTGKERRNSYHGQRKNNKKRCNSYSRSFESKENLPEWVTHEGVWDMETQDPVKEFIRAIALDEGYGTCENTVTDEIKEITQGKIGINENMVPEWDDSLDLDAEWVITEDLNPRVRTPMEEELYAKFEAKFDRSIEALWSKDQNTPDDEYQDLPIDFQDLLSSPSDRLFADPSAEKCSLISLTESIWSTDAADFPPPLDRGDSPALHDRFRPLNLADVVEPQPRELESFALYEGDEIYDALATVANTMRSFTAINHSRDRSGFVEVPPRRGRDRRLAPGPCAAPEQLAPGQLAPGQLAPGQLAPGQLAPGQLAPGQLAPGQLAPAPPARPREDLLTSARTHFRPIRREPDAEPPRYADGDTFDISGDPDPVEFRRSESGGAYLCPGRERYLEYRAARGIDYGRLNLTPAQRCPDLASPGGLRLRFPLRQRDAGVQTEAAGACEECGRAAKKMRASAARCVWSRAAPPAGLLPAAEAEDDARAELLLAAEAEDEARAELLLGAEAEDEARAELLLVAEAEDEARAELLLGAAAEDEAGAERRLGAAAEAEARADRKRRHSAALRCAALCSHPHARFLPCCADSLSLDRPLTR